MHFLKVVNGNFQEPLVQFDDEMLIVRESLGTVEFHAKKLLWMKAHVELDFHLLR
jgi:hypothetical protein